VGRWPLSHFDRLENFWSRGENLWSRGEDLWSRGEDLWSRGEDLWSRGENFWSRGQDFWSRSENLRAMDENFWARGEDLRSRGENLWARGERLRPPGEILRPPGEGFRAPGQGLPPSPSPPDAVPNLRFLTQRRKDAKTQKGGDWMNENESSWVIVSAGSDVHRPLGGPGLLEAVEEALAFEPESLPSPAFLRLCVFAPLR